MDILLVNLSVNKGHLFAMTTHTSKFEDNKRKMPKQHRPALDGK
jgi:hypothetical protein